MFYFQSSHINSDSLKLNQIHSFLSTLFLFEILVSGPSGEHSSLLTSDTTQRDVNKNLSYLMPDCKQQKTSDNSKSITNPKRAELRKGQEDEAPNLRTPAPLNRMGSKAVLVSSV